MPDQPIRALLFDLGGVLIDIDFDRVFQSWQPISRLSFEEMKARFRFDLPYRQHERGQLDATGYFAHLRRRLALHDDHARIVDGWNAIFTGEIAVNMRMVRAARSQLPCHVFSNTNATHKHAWSARYPAIAASFDRVFASCDIGLRKPEHAAFAHVARTIGVSPQAIMFFDDSAENVAGAAACGLHAVHERRPADVEAALRGIGVTLESGPATG